MNRPISLILSAPVIRATIRNTLGSDQYDVIERPGAYVLSLKNEPVEHCRRIIILKPKGFTSNSMDELSSHPEAREATVEIKGAARASNTGFFPIKDCIEFVHLNKDDAQTRSNYPYASAEKAFREVKSSRTKFKVVSRNHYGFYHNLINLTDEWIVLILDKRLNHSKKVDYSFIDGTGNDSVALHELAIKIAANGDGIFKSSHAMVKSIYAMNPNVSLPALITLLNVEERGRHEQCTVFAMILNVAKKHSSLALKLLKNAEKDEAAQPYYLRELIGKIKKYPK